MPGYFIRLFTQDYFSVGLYYLHDYLSQDYFSWIIQDYLSRGLLERRRRENFLILTTVFVGKMSYINY